MPRAPRAVVPGCAYHLLMRGNERKQVFFGDEDCSQYLLWLAEYSAQYGMQTWAYCLMPNHVHLIAVPDGGTTLGDVFRALQMRYSRRINDRMQRQGHLWQGRFHACALDDPHLVAAVRYVEQNPVRAGLVGRAEDFMWSSASPHCGLRRDPVLAANMPLLERIRDWRDWLRVEDDPVMLTRLRECTTKCEPCGTEKFAARFRKE